MKKAVVIFSFIFLTVGWVFTAEDNLPVHKDNSSYKFPELKFFPRMPENPDNPVTVEGVNLGRLLFNAEILSADSSFSCQSCHKPQFAFGDSTRFSKGIGGELMKRNTMPLFTLAWYEAFFWDGRAASLEVQVFEPVRNHAEMNLDWKTVENRLNKSKYYKQLFKKTFGIKYIDSVHVAKAIAQFERSLISHNSKYDRVLRGETVLSPDEYAGFVLINDQTKGNCLHCHTSDANALGTTGKFSNNGLDKILKDDGKGKITGKKEELGQFKIPSLRNLSFTAPYMHDGRFKTLEEVLDFYNEDVQDNGTIDSKMMFHLRKGMMMTEEEKKQIILFLKTLDDSIFVNYWKINSSSFR